MGKSMGDAIRDAKSGRFLLGHKAGGRPRGSRSKLSEDFLRDLHASWEKHGVSALDRAVALDPVAYIRVVASILPKDIDFSIDMTVQKAMNAVEAFRMLQALPAAELRQIKTADVD